MKLQSIKYQKDNSTWYSTESIPDNPRSVLIYTEDGGTAEATYDYAKDEWTQFRWSCKVNPLYWREMPRYDNKCSV